MVLVFRKERRAGRTECGEGWEDIAEDYELTRSFGDDTSAYRSRAKFTRRRECHRSSFRGSSHRVQSSLHNTRSVFLGWSESQQRGFRTGKGNGRGRLVIEERMVRVIVERDKERRVAGESAETGFRGALNYIFEKGGID